MTPAVLPHHPRSRALVRATFVAWIVCCLVAGAYMLGAHLLTLPKPDAGDLQRSAVMGRLPSQRGRWLAVHVLDQDCKCSQRVLDHLLAGPRPLAVAERVVLIASAVAPERIAAITAAGFDLDIVTPDQLFARYHLEAAPLLVVADPANTVRYIGGYGPRKQAADLRDVAMIEALERGERVAPLPTFGCAVSRGLRTAVDPLGIRSWK